MKFFFRKTAPLALLLIIWSCKKEPEASFSVSNTSPSPGEQVVLTNTSTNMESCIWEIDVGVFSTQISPTVVYPVSGTKQINLTVYNGNKKGFATQTITVRQEGKVSFWQTSADFAFNVDLTIGSTTKTVTAFTASPACDQLGSANFTLAPGTYSYTAAQQSPGTQTWSGTVIITDGGCLLKQLF